MRKSIVGAAVAGLALIGAGQLQAQSALVTGTSSETASYQALHATPIGAVAPLAPNMGRQVTGFRGHYGRHDMRGTNTNTFAVGADFPAGMQTSFGFTFGWRNIENADDHFMVGTNLSGNLAGGSPTGVMPQQARLGVSYRAELGYGRSGDTDALGAALSLPLSVPVASGQTRITPFLSPGMGWGRLSGNGDSDSAVRFMLGGGLGLEMAGGTGIHVGARRVFYDNADMQYGLGVTLRPRR
jgi:hypothetical protein